MIDLRFVDGVPPMGMGLTAVALGSTEAAAAEGSGCNGRVGTDTLRPGSPATFAAGLTIFSARGDCVCGGINELRGAPAADGVAEAICERNGVDENSVKLREETVVAVEPVATAAAA